MEKQKEKDFIILISPLNTIYTYNFEYINKNNHALYYNQFFNNNNKEIIINPKLEILPYIEENVFKKNIEENLIRYFHYYAKDVEEKNIIIKEHEYLKLNKYFIPKFILKKDLISSNNKTKYIIFISPNYKEDFTTIESSGNIIRILNWMLYKKSDDYVEHQKETFKYITYNQKTKTNNCELIIECLRQCNLLIKYCYNNLSKINVPDNFRLYLLDNFINKSIKCLNILDHNSTSKLYRKRELAQTSEKVYYIPFMHHFVNLKDENDFDKYYKNINIILQRNPYFYNSNKELYMKYFQEIFDKKKNIVQLHHISIIDQLFNRYLVYQLLSDFAKGINDISKELNINLKIPFSSKYKINDNFNNLQNLSELKKLILETNTEMTYPFIIKPINCEYHEMRLVINEEGLKELFSNDIKYKEFIFKYKDFIIQKYINHGGEMIKTFCINGQSYEFIRPSIPNLNLNKTEELTKIGEINLTNELIYQSKKNKIFGENRENNDINEILKEKFNIVNKITLLFLERTKITLFGLDFLYDNIKDTFYILEINYFPSYRELGNKINSEFEQHVIKFYNKYKTE